MAVTPDAVEPVLPLSTWLTEGARWSHAECLAILGQVASRVDELHGSGWIHGAISMETVTLDARHIARLEPAPAHGPIGGDSSAEDEPIPLEIRRQQPWRVPAEIATARAVFEAEGVAFDPRHIDLYQLGALFCRLLTGATVSDYLRSSKVKSQVPIAAQVLIDGALRLNPTQRFADVAELVSAAATAAKQTGNQTESIESAAAVAPAGHGAQLDDTTPDGFTARPLPDTDLPVRTSKSQAAPRTDSGPAEPLPFARLGQYRIEARIGHGGMGDVYKGYDDDLQRAVAIKVLPADLARHPEFVKRFYAEAASVAKLVHPNVVQVYFIGRDAGHHFFAMQYVEGESLGDMLARRGRLTVDETLAICEQCLAGLATAHAQGLVHRDIKPGNILLDRHYRRALLADFGLAKIVDAAGQMTATGIVLGTLDYISPEQGRGQAVDGRSDLYSFGALMYEALSGRVPFEADTPTAVLFKHAYDLPPPLNQAVPDVPRPLAAVVEKLLSKSPDERHPTAEALLDDLRAFRARQPLPSRADLISAKTGGASARQSVMIQAPSFPDPPPFPAELLESPADRSWWERTREKLHSVFQRYAPEVIKQLQSTQQQVDGAVAEYERRQQVLADLVREAETICTDLKTQLSEHRQASKAGTLEEQAQHEQTAAELNQRLIEQHDELATIRVRLAQVDAALQQLRSRRDLLNARLKAAEAKLVFGGRTRLPVSLRRKLANSPALLAASVLTAAALLLIAIVAVATSRPGTARVLIFDSELSVELAGKVIRPDGRDHEVRLNGSKVQVRIYLNGVPAHESILDFARGRTTTLRISRERDQARIDVDGTIMLATLKLPKRKKKEPSLEPAIGEAGELIFQLRSAVQAVSFRSQFSARHQYQFATGHADGTLLLFELAEDGKPRVPTLLSESQKTINSLAFSPTDDLLACSGDDLTIRLLRTGGRESEVRRLQGHTQPVRVLAFSADGKRLLSGGDDSTLRVWEVETGRELQRVNVLLPVRAAAWSSDEEHFVVGHGSERNGKTGPLARWNLAARARTTEISTDNATTLEISLAPASGLGYSLHAKAPLLVWNSTTGERVGTLGRNVSLAAFAGNGLQILTADPAGDLTLWNSETGKPLQQVAAEAQPVTRLALSADGEVAVTAHRDDTLRVRKFPPSADVQKVIRVGTPVECLVFSSDGEKLVAGDLNKVEAWEAGHRWPRSYDAKAVVSCVTYLPNGLGIVYATGARNSATNLVGIRATHGFGFEPRPGDGELATFYGHADRITGLACTRDSTRAISSSLDGTVRVWDVARKQQIQNLSLGSPIHALALSPQSANRVLLSLQEGVELWDLEPARKVREFTGLTPPVRCAAFSDDGARVIAAGGAALRVWDAESALPLARFEGHVGAVNAALLLNQGRFAVSASDDGTVRLWNVASQQPTATFRGHWRPVRSLAVSPREETVASGSDDGTIRIWKLPAAG
jgi:serine/threonine protein kinase/WD40 repeat protein